MLVSGNELRVGDVLAVCWGNKRDVITALPPYEPMPQVIRECFPRGAWLADFASGMGMTIGCDRYYDVIARGAA